MIVGAGLAGAKAAETLRAEGFDGRIVLIGRENERPYERPPLSKEVLLGKKDDDSVYVHEAGWYAEHDVELREGVEAQALDLAERRVGLSDGSSVEYTRLLLAMGATPRRLRVPGANLEGVSTLRTRADSLALRARISGGGLRVAIVGGGWIGLEVAAAARTYGNEVTVLEAEATPLHVPLGPEVGALFADLHRAHGVEIRCGEGLFALRGEGSVDHVTTSLGHEIPADLVLMGVGAVPEDSLARAAGLKCENGVLVDSSLRTDDPDVYAAGDVASAYHPLYRRHLRVEHWANALNAGPAAARSMLGQDVTYDRVPYFFSDQYDLGMEFSGYATPGAYDKVVFRGDPASGEYIAFWLSQGAVVAAMNANIWDVTDPLQSLIRSGKKVEESRLTDPAVPLADL
ncbi:3-phenylpropionate/trans-cinnamate dioxygenase ferredoxin reductase subunit [Actinocorallia herbida]|uniref:3-phenylpropionate/trans-cinnamate dioxygenase ferredoxin reductase subunit n=1 Tax=Actinocorallia herbida TaxID=58109 RepID=A0A3N1CSP9_9ACTN|nr:3-phenylpropionate/trans-cinnamate dioxygenase ferredoxin reductase subunit [Actinocorallia herbida]